jgi:hypothetical protein
MIEEIQLFVRKNYTKLVDKNISLSISMNSINGIIFKDLEDMFNMLKLII